ncbi:MAG: SCP2 sterol-binding domain-containing protein [Alphaproteobacteria bacterium]|nr:SCP2 sterol-binding domain-containing protein [Alphaproteobacteria bacterium]
MPPASPYTASEDTPFRAPVLPLSLALCIAPGGLVDAALSTISAVARRRHPRLFARLEPLGPTGILIDPVDLPVVFHLEIDGARTTLRALARGQDMEERPRTTVRGPLSALLDLLEGRVDGDALFFARRLAVEGDTAPVVALRNALEAEPVKLDALVLAPLWPFDGIARHLAPHALAAIQGVDRHLAALRQAVEQPLAARVDDQERELRRIAARLARLETPEERP